MAGLLIKVPKSVVVVAAITPPVGANRPSDATEMSAMRSSQAGRGIRNGRARDGKSYLGRVALRPNTHLQDLGKSEGNHAEADTNESADDDGTSDSLHLLAL